MNARAQMREFIAQASIRAGSTGFTVADIEAAGHNKRKVDSCINRMVADGVLHKGKIGHRTMRLFARSEWANAFAAGRRSLSSPAKTTGRMKAGWAPGQQAEYPVDADGKPLYKFTSITISDEELRQAQMRNVRRWNGNLLVRGRAA